MLKKNAKILELNLPCNLQTVSMDIAHISKRKRCSNRTKSVFAADVVEPVSSISVLLSLHVGGRQNKMSYKIAFENAS